MKKLTLYLELFIQAVIFFSLIMYFVELEYANPENGLAGHPFFLWAEHAIAAIFTVEYVVRWRYSPNKWRYPFTFLAIVDLLAILPFYVGFMFDMRSLRIIRTLRILRLLKIYRYNEALQSFAVSFARIRRELYIVGVAVLFLVFLSSTMEHECERLAQPEKFGKFTDAVWWSFVTLTTVGYGDVFPVTLSGRLVAIVTLILGMGIFGTFLSLIGSAFISTMQEKGKGDLGPIYARLQSRQMKKGLPTDPESLRRLLVQIVDDYMDRKQE
jgi:voltage-gated potassium channel